MIAFFRRHKFWMWTLCITLLVVRIGGAHWHLCFDGNEPPAALHTGDAASIHHADDDHLGMDKTDAYGGDHFSTDHHVSFQPSGYQHTDVDLNLVDDGLFKLLAKHFPAALTLLVFTLLMCAARRSPLPPYFAPFFPQLALHRSPPPRGPPR